VAMETRLDRKMEMVNVAVSPVVPNADVDKHNPIDKIPALSVKGMDLFDSPVICEYLDSLHKGRKLLPRKGRERWVALCRRAWLIRKANRLGRGTIRVIVFASAMIWSPAFHCVHRLGRRSCLLRMAESTRPCARLASSPLARL
jgi:glutathione S-transferase